MPQTRVGRAGTPRDVGGRIAPDPETIASELTEAGLSITQDRGWVTVVDERRSPPDELSGGTPEELPLNTPGLWRLADGPGASGARRIFEVHASGVGRVGTGRAGDSGSGAWMDLACLDPTWIEVLRWAIATSDPRGGAGDWKPPIPSEIERFAPRDRLTLRIGSELRQGRVVRDEGRLALDFPVCSVPGGLSVARREWLATALRDGRSTWRMVRLGTDDRGQTRAVVDLTGAPHHALAHLCTLALDALRWVVEWIVPIAAFIADASNESRILEAAPTRAALACASLP